MYLFYYFLQANKDTEDGYWSVNDVERDDDTLSIVSEDGKSEILDDYLSEAGSSSAASSALVESLSAQHRQEMDSIKAELEKKDQQNRLLQKELEDANKEMQVQLKDNKKKTDKQEQEFAKLMKKMEDLQIEKKRIEAEKDEIRKMEQVIKTIDYKGIAIEIIQDVLTPNFGAILDYLKKAKNQPMKYLSNRIPHMRFDRKTNEYIVTIIGVQEHHDIFKTILKRARDVLQLKKGAINFYQRKVYKMTNGIKRELSRMEQKDQYWRQYQKLFVQYIDEKSKEYPKMFNDFLGQKMISLIEKSISDDSTVIRKEIHSHTNDFMKDHNLLHDDVEPLKFKALQEFIQQNITNQRNHLEKKPSLKSIKILEEFIEKVRKTFKTDPRYIGHETKHYNMIPELLQRLMLYYCCFKIQLPLYESSDVLLDKIEKNTVVTIATSTGSGILKYFSIVFSESFN